MTKAVWGSGIRATLAIVVTVATVSCGDLTRQGTASSYLIITSLEGASGAAPETFANNVVSDVVTVVNDSPTVFNDLGRVSFQLAMKDPGAAGSPTVPTSANWITVDRYRVTYMRTDGRNTPGVDVPYPFDSGLTVTVSDASSAGFMLVRNQAKQEVPLVQLQNNGILLSMIAEVTFYGHDQTGRSVSVSGRIGINFGNFADPD